MSGARRTFGALLSHDGVCLVEYQAERAGIHVVDHRADNNRSASIDEAYARLVRLVSSLGIARARIAIAIEQFGAFHHVMALPPAADDVLRPVIRREVQRVFGLTDPVFAFTRGDANVPADPRSGPQQLFIGGVPQDTIDALTTKLGSSDIEIELATVIPKAIHSLYQASEPTLEPTAVLVCLEGGPHLAFFLDGRLELAVDPPIALEGERPPVPVILDQVERGAVYLRQQFRGAAATRMLLAAPDAEYETLAAALEQRLALRVEPLFFGVSSTAAVVAMGAVLEARSASPLDLFPHPPTLFERSRALLRGPNAIVAGMATAAAIAGIWSGTQLVSARSLRLERDSLQAALQSELARVAPMQRIAEVRADFSRRLQFVSDTRAERAALSGTLEAIARRAPAGVRFDTLRVSRATAGWSVTIAGRAAGPSAAQAVRDLDDLYQTVRSLPGVASAALDQFDYSSPVGADSVRRTSGPVIAAFHVSFALAQRAEGTR